MAQRTALVTGANRGLGLETARQLAKRGFSVLLTSRDERTGRAAAESLDATVEHRPLDVASRDSIAALAARLRDDGVTLDVLVNNAGVALDGFNADVVRRTLDVNFFGAMHTSDALLDRIRDGGAIVNVSSGVGELDGLPEHLFRELADPLLTRGALIELMNRFQRDVTAGRHTDEGWPSSAYRVSKIGLNALTRIMARELSDRRIRVNAVCPGWVRTDMGGSAAPRSVERGAASIVTTAVLEDGPTGTFFRDGEEIEW